MPAADFFKKLGLYVARDFLSAQACERLVAEARAVPRHGAPVYVGGQTMTLDEERRRTVRAEVTDETAAFLSARFLERKPELERHFGLALAGCEPPQLLVYREGDFFAPHQDQSPARAAQERFRRRRVSMVLFLNGETAEAEASSYGGGALVFFGLIDDPRCRQMGFPLAGERGLLVAFRADTLHEVRPVTRGERFTVVSWFG